jgi:hypothetical protein
MTDTPVPPVRWIEPELVEYDDFPDAAPGPSFWKPATLDLVLDVIEKQPA